jgi:hypothetical protein
MNDTTSVTDLPCQAEGRGATHHMVPRGGQANRHLHCLYCGKTERLIRQEQGL